jgi:hypothetical protein
MSLETPPELLVGLNSTDVRWYVLKQGWKPQATKNPALMVFNAPFDRNLQLQVPKSGSEPDVQIMMAEVIRKLAEAERRPINEVSHDVRHPFEDILRLRVQSKLLEAGTLPLADGLNLFQGGKELLVAAACSAHQPQAYYLRKSYKPVEEFINSCQLGQTAIGSFVATILTPPMAPAQPSLFNDLEEVEEDAPFERRVTLRLMHGLRVLDAAVQSGDGSLIDDGVASGVSADLCDALSGITPPEEQAILQVEMGWSPVRPRVPEDVRSPIRFAAPDLAFIRDAGQRLRRKILRPETIEGRIHSLKADPKLFRDDHGEVTLRTVIDGKPGSVRFALGRGDYVAACNAHRDNRPVHVTGTLRRGEQSKLFVLDDPRDFAVVTPV